MYLKEVDAMGMVRAMFSHCRTMVAMAGLAHPAVDNAGLVSSDIRKRDRTFIHNLDRMVTSGGGRVQARRWEGARQVDGQTIYFVFAAPR